MNEKISIKVFSIILVFVFLVILLFFVLKVKDLHCIHDSNPYTSHLDSKWNFPS